MSEQKLHSSYALASAGTTSQARCHGHKAAASISSNEDKGTRDKEPEKWDTSKGKKVKKTRYVVSVLFI